jgi:hypothetical protein
VRSTECVDDDFDLGDARGNRPRDDRVVSIDVHRLATRVNSEQLQTHEISNDVM